jgi:hypothetical protein
MQKILKIKCKLIEHELNRLNNKMGLYSLQKFVIQ